MIPDVYRVNFTKSLWISWEGCPRYLLHVVGPGGFFTVRVTFAQMLKVVEGFDNLESRFDYDKNIFSTVPVGF